MKRIRINRLFRVSLLVVVCGLGVGCDAGNVERKIAQVDQAAQAYIEHSKKLGSLTDVAGAEAEKAKQAIRAMVGREPAPPAEAPVAPKQP